MNWLSLLKHDPITPLLASGDGAVAFFTRRDLLGESQLEAAALWRLKEPLSILRKQQPGGYWRYPGQGEDYYLLATFKSLMLLVYKYGFNRTHPAAARAAEYLFSYQTEEGDVRGFIGNQYAPYYTGLVMALLITAGYQDDPRVAKAMKWLLGMRQDDGGWVIGSPGFLGLGHITREELCYLTSDRSAPTMKAFEPAMPSSHAGTGMVIRAFAAHPRYRHSPEAARAAALLKSRFFQEDSYTSYQHPDHWLRFQYPFWWNNLLAALDALAAIGLAADDADIRRGLDWLIAHQEVDGMWQTSYSSIHRAPDSPKSRESRPWISLSCCRVLRAFHASKTAE